MSQKILSEREASSNLDDLINIWNFKKKKMTQLIEIFKLHCVVHVLHIVHNVYSVQSLYYSVTVITAAYITLYDTSNASPHISYCMINAIQTIESIGSILQVSIDT